MRYNTGTKNINIRSQFHQHFLSLNVLHKAEADDIYLFYLFGQENICLGSSCALSAYQSIHMK